MFHKLPVTVALVSFSLCSENRWHLCILRIEIQVNIYWGYLCTARFDSARFRALWAKCHERADLEGVQVWWMLVKTSLKGSVDACSLWYAQLAISGNKLCGWVLVPHKLTRELIPFRIMCRVVRRSSNCNVVSKGFGEKNGRAKQSRNPENDCRIGKHRRLER